MILRVFACCWLLLLAIWHDPAQAHALEPGFLDIRAVAADNYTVGWKVPQVAGRPMRIEALLPETCTARTPPALLPTGNAFSAHWTTACAGGLAGREIAISGLERTSTDVLVRFQSAAGTAQTMRLTPDRPAAVLLRDPGFWEVVQTYTVLGIDHILGGIDHILFVLALILLIGPSWKLVKTITAFTLAHSVTLSAAALRVVHIPGPPVEATIALSILFLAHEIAVREPGHPRLAERKPWLVAFAFGLLHGLGFAGALAETGLPQNEIPAALLTFNLGVEIGQLAFIAAVLLVWFAWRQMAGRSERGKQAGTVAMNGAVYAIGAVSAYWLIERVAGF